MIRSVSPVRPIAGLLSAEPELLSAAQRELETYFQAPAMASESTPFTHTSYYAAEMGNDLLRQFVVMGALCDPARLVEWKIWSQDVEQRFGRREGGGRRINLDPGYIAPGKLVLATTKDHEHRLYLREGLYAEVTLRVRDKSFQPWSWTYPDYAQAVEFFNRAYRDYLSVLGHAQRKD